MTATTAELRESVAGKIKILRADMPLDAADAATIDRKIGEVTNYYRERGVVWWVDNAIPNAAVLPMTMLVAAWTADDFGKVADPLWAPNGLALLASIKPSAAIETVKMVPF